MNKDVHFLNNCIPKFHDIFKSIALKAYNFVYNKEDEVTEADIYKINLDTGRSLAHSKGTDLSYPAAFWEV